MTGFEGYRNPVTRHTKDELDNGILRLGETSWAAGWIARGQYALPRMVSVVNQLGLFFDEDQAG
jgi:hypothetical protein